MGILAFLKTITDIRSAGNLFLELIAFLKKNKLFPVLYLLPVLLLIINYLHFNLVVKDKEIAVVEKRINICNSVDDELRRCGDKTAISISIIRNDQKSGRFFVARACDKRLTNSGCILDLMENKPLTYKAEYKLDLNSEDFLRKIMKSGFPRSIPLSKDGKQIIDPELEGCSTIINLITATDWWKEGIVKNLWITASETTDHKILYVYTFKTAINESGCQNQINQILLDLIQKMKNGGEKWFHF